MLRGTDVQQRYVKSEIQIFKFRFFDPCFLTLSILEPFPGISVLYATIYPKKVPNSVFSTGNLKTQIHFFCFFAIPFRFIEIQTFHQKTTENGFKVFIFVIFVFILWHFRFYFASFWGRGGVSLFYTGTFMFVPVL